MTVQIRSGKCLRAIAAAALVWGVTPAAHAFDDSLGVLAPLDSAFELGLGRPLFFDTLTFELDAPVAGSFAVKGKGFSLPGVPVVIPPAKDLTFAIYKGGVNLTGFGTAFSGLHLTAGSDYSFEVTGKPGIYHVTWSLVPVPEPETVVMALAGFALVAGVARRRLPQP